MAGTKRVINIGTNADDGTGDLLRSAFEKINLNFDDIWTYGAVNSNLNITANSIVGTTDVIIDPADTGAFKVAGDTIINPDNGNFNFTVNTDLASDVLYVKGSSGFVGIKNNAPTVALDVTGDAKVSGSTTLATVSISGNTVLGNANTDTVTYNAKAATDFLPVSTTQNLGAVSNRWGTLNTTNIDASGTITGTFTGTVNSTIASDVNNTNITTVNLTATGPSNVQNLTVTGDLVVQGTTTTLETNDVLVNNQITFEGSTADAHETIVTVVNPTQDNTISFKNASGTVAFISDIPTGINNLSDVDTSTTPPTNGQALVWNNSNLEWEPGTVGGGSEVNDLTAAVTWANIPDANVPASAVTQHQASLSITESQISDLGTYLTSVPAQSFASLTGKPTTIAGYGITDGGIASVVSDTTPQLGGNLDAQAFNITTTGKILYSNMYSAEADLPNATTYHGMFAHVHGTGAGYFAHGGNWIKLANAGDYADGVNVGDESSDTTCFPMFGTGQIGALTVKTDGSAYTYNASTETLSVTNFVGDGSGLTNVETITLATLKSTVAASSDFADFQSRIAAL